MNARCRCKFKVDWVRETEYEPNYKVHEVKLRAICGTDGENKSFAEATPSGSMEFTITNPALIGAFKPGEEFYIDFIPAS